MAVRTILTWPSRALRKISDKASIEESQDIAVDLYDTLKANFGLGIAASQVGIRKRVVVVLSKEIPEFSEEINLEGAIVFVNPRFSTSDSDKVQSQEACLSVPGIAAVVDRFSGIAVSYENISGETLTVDVKGRTACILQHEFDHLDGKLFIDRLSPIRKTMILKKMKKRNKKLKPPKPESAVKAEQAAKRKKARIKRKRKSKGS